MAYIRTPEIKKKISESLKTYFSNPKIKKELSLRNSGKKNPRYGKPLSFESRKLLSEKMKGDKNHQYKHGLRNKKYDFKFNKRFRVGIQKRDGNACRICLGTERLAVHHINYDSYDTREDNCITLCNLCHIKTNSNRDYWRALFTPVTIGGMP